MATVVAIVAIAIAGNVGGVPSTNPDAPPATAASSADGATGAAGDERPPSLSLGAASYPWTVSELDEGVEVKVLNDTSRNIPFNVRVVLFGLESGDKNPKPLETTDVVRSVSKLEPPTEVKGGDEGALTGRTSVPPGGTRVLELASANPPAQLAVNRYSGFVTVFADGDERVARAPVTLTVVGKTGTVAPTPAATSQTMQAVRWSPFGDRLVEVRGDWIPLAGSVDQSVSDESLTLERNAYLGTLAGDEGGVAAVRFAGRTKKLPSELAGIEIDVDGFDGPGAYKGKLDLIPGDPKAGEIELTVIVKDSIIWAILALGIGLVAALLARRWENVHRHIRAWGSEEAAVSVAYENARTLFQRDARRQSWREFDSKTDFDERVKALQELMAETGDRSGTAISDDDREKVLDELADLEAHVTSLGSLHKKALALDRALDAVEALPKIDYLLANDDPRQPAFVTWARDLLGGEEITVEDLGERLEEIEEATLPIAAFSKLHELACRGASRLAELGTQAPFEMREEVDEAHEALAKAWQEVWTGEDAKAALGSGPRKRVLAALSTVAGLKAVVEELPQYASLADESQLHILGMRRAAAETREMEQTISVLDALDAGDVVREAPADPAERLRYYVASRQLGDRWMMAVSAAVALYTGLFALYFDNTWGTPTDYLIALFWGFATAATVDTLAATVNAALNPKALVKTADAEKD